MKKLVKVWLEPDQERELKRRAEEQGFTGRGAIPDYMRHILKYDYLIIDKNAEKLISRMNLKS